LLEKPIRRNSVDWVGRFSDSSFNNKNTDTLGMPVGLTTP
jgi:hypothetical protein